MLLIKHEFPDVYNRTAKFLNVLDYINLRLTGKMVCTFDSILTSWVTDNRDPNHVVYSAELLRDSGISADKFPDIVPGITVIGELKPDVAAGLGLGRGVKVVAGAIDTGAAAIGAGAVEDYDTHLYIGTSSWLAAHLPYKKTDVASSMASLPCPLPGKYMLVALQATAGGNLTFLRDQVLYHHDELSRQECPPDFYTLLDQIAAGVPAGSRGVIYTPWIYGERAPVDDRQVRASIYNLSLENSRLDILRAVLEGIAFNTRWLLKPFEKFMGRKLTCLHIAGGGASSNAWCQIFADVLDLVVRQVKDPIQANARGAALIAALGLELISIHDIPRLTEFQGIYHPRPENRQIYDHLFAEFVNIYQQNKAIFHRLNK